MDTSTIIEWSREAIRLALMLGAPLLLTALLAGLVIGVGQTLTQLHEPVISLVPRLVAVVVAVLVLLPWLVGRWSGFATLLIESIPTLAAGA